uniref:N-alpha-acetyltransferase 35, NatC auxiliary subunit n=1 Tax=Cucumis melo TaxID=3656 RepID=A0A9I9CYP6_CUCME
MADKEPEQGTMATHSPQIASPIPSGENTVWADVSPLLEAACRDLQDGELIHGETFNLFSAMSALEIMDPKMDSGMICKYYSVDEAIENGAAPIPLSFDRTVDVQCNIDIMDHLLSCEEEDLFIMAYGLPLSGDGDDKCLSRLNAVEETICRQLRACKSPLLKNRAPEGNLLIPSFDVEPLQNSFDLEEHYCRALLCRLRFRKHFYHVLACMRRPQGRGLELARKHIASCLLELDLIRNSSTFLSNSSFGISKDDLEDTTTASGRQPIGFDSSLNCRLSAPTPPRAIKLLSWKKALDYFVKLLRDLDNICSYSLDTFLEGVFRFVVQFQKSQPDLVARSLLQFLLVQDGKLYGREPLYAVITKAAGLPESAKNHENLKNQYIVQLGQCRTLTANAVSDKFAQESPGDAHNMLFAKEQGNMEMAFKKDIAEIVSISNGENAWMKIFQHILIWVEEQTYWISSRFLVLGFELELYSPGDYCMVYWYLSVVLIKLVEKIHLRALMSNETGKRKGKKKGASKDIGKDFRIPPAVSFLQCQICLAEGLVMMLAALRNEHMIAQSPSPFNSEYERFFQHFELLQKACIPDNITYDSYEQSTRLARISVGILNFKKVMENLVTYNCFKDAQKIAKELKSSFSNDPEKLVELRRIEQVAEHNSVALNLIHKVGGLDPSLKISFEFNHHPYFGTAL